MARLPPMPLSPEPEYRSPSALYRARVASAALTDDPRQEAAIRALDRLAKALDGYALGNGEHGWRARLGLATPPAPPPKGLYLYGAVGRGKSMLMDLFFAAAPVAKKRRVHFYAFMQEVHGRVHERRAEKGDPIAPVAAQIAAEAALLCFDEFDVTDIADAMILGRLFQALFAAGVVVVATSNRAPDDLYKDGLQRDRFMPFIAMLKDRMNVMELSGNRDYRLRRFAGRGVYFTPPDAAARAALESAFADLTDGSPGKQTELIVLGRRLVVPRAAKEVAWFDFSALCAQPLGPPDYLALCDAFHTLIIEAIPIMNRDRRDEARRFTMLIDTLYDVHGNLVASADALPRSLYPEGDGSFEFQRTVSRLNEMQSADYIAARRG